MLSFALISLFHYRFIHEIYPVRSFERNIEEAKEKKNILALYSDKEYQVILVRGEVIEQYKYIFISSMYYTDEFYFSIVNKFDKRSNIVITNGKDTLYFDIKGKGGQTLPVDSIYKAIYLTVNDTINRKINLVEIFEQNRVHLSIPFYKKMTLGLLIDDITRCFTRKTRSCSP